MTVKELLALFQRMYVERWAYQWGAAQTGLVDCSGAFVWAYRQYGLSIYHGSNRMARKEVAALLPVSQARPGMMAFKVRTPGQRDYNLPDIYREGGREYNGDLLDYHHVGLVDEDPRYVLNAKNKAMGFQRSRITEGWDAVGYAVQIDYGSEEEDPMDKELAVVIAESGSTVNLRRTPDRNGALVERVPVGTVVEVLEKLDGWMQIRYANRTGYMMAQFLRLMDDSDPEGDDGPPDALVGRVRRVEERLDDLERRVKALEDRR